MKVIRSKKYRIFPNELQKEMLHRWFGADRWMWNYMVNKVFNEKFDRSKLNSYSLRDDILNNGPEFINRKTRKYIPDSSVDCCAVRFMTAYKLYTKSIDKSKKTSSWTNVDKYKPKMKSKKEKSDICNLSKKSDKFFTLDNGYINIRTTKFYKRQTFISNKKIDIPVDDIKTCSILHKNNKYYIIFHYETQIKKIINKKCVIGIDTGIKNTITFFDGESSNFLNIPTKIFSLNKQISYLDKKLSTKRYESKRYFKALKRLNKVYNKKTNIVRDFYNKYINYLINNYNVINIDRFNLDVKKSDYKFINKKKRTICTGYFIQRLTEKAEEYQIELNIIPKGTPTTQTCSNCGNIKKDKEKLNLADRIYKCNKCGYEEDRDINAAKNIYKYSI